MIKAIKIVLNYLRKLIFSKIKKIKLIYNWFVHKKAKDDVAMESSTGSEYLAAVFRQWLTLPNFDSSGHVCSSVDFGLAVSSTRCSHRSYSFFSIEVYLICSQISSFSSVSHKLQVMYGDEITNKFEFGTLKKYAKHVKFIANCSPIHQIPNYYQNAFN